MISETEEMEEHHLVLGVDKLLYLAHREQSPVCRLGSGPGHLSGGRGPLAVGLSRYHYHPALRSGYRRVSSSLICHGPSLTPLHGVGPQDANRNCIRLPTNC